MVLTVPVQNVGHAGRLPRQMTRTRCGKVRFGSFKRIYWHTRVPQPQKIRYRPCRSPCKISGKLSFLVEYKCLFGFYPVDKRPVVTVRNTVSSLRSHSVSVLRRMWIVTHPVCVRHVTRTATIIGNTVVLITIIYL